MFSHDHTNLGSIDDHRSHVPFVIAATTVALVFVGWILYARGSYTPAIEAAYPAATQRNAETLGYYGNGQLKVLSFYANPAAVKRGARSLVCYGVSNAASVRIEPSLGETWPSTSRCLEVIASKDTDYKLTVRDAAGHEEARVLSLRVLP